MKGEALRLFSDVLSFTLTALFLSGCSLGGYVIGSAIDADAERTIDTSEAVPPGMIHTLPEEDSIEVLFHTGGRLRCVYEKTELRDVRALREEYETDVLTRPGGRRYPAPGDTVTVRLSVGRRTMAILAGYDTADVVCLGGPDQEYGVRIPASEIDSIWSRNAGGMGRRELQKALRSGTLPRPSWSVTVRSAEGLVRYPLESIAAVWIVEEPRATVYCTAIGAGLDVIVIAAIVIANDRGYFSFGNAYVPPLTTMDRY